MTQGLHSQYGSLLRFLREMTQVYALAIQELTQVYTGIDSGFALFSPRAVSFPAT